MLANLNLNNACSSLIWLLVMFFLYFGLLFNMGLLNNLYFVLVVYLMYFICGI